MKNLHHFLFVLVLILTATLLSVSEEIRIAVMKNTQIDTIGHFFSFFFLSWLLCSIVKLPTMSTMYCLLAYAAASELGQHYLGYRNGEIKDFVADVLGVLLFVFLRWCAMVYWKKKEI